MFVIIIRRLSLSKKARTTHHEVLLFGMRLTFMMAKVKLTNGAVRFCLDVFQRSRWENASGDCLSRFRDYMHFVALSSLSRFR